MMEMNASQLPEGVLQASLLSEAMATLSKQTKLHRIYIIGGAQLYNASLKDESVADRVLLTQITRGHEDWTCDTFFPQLNASIWQKTSHRQHQEWLEGVDVPDGEVEEGKIAWRYELWTRK